MARKTTKSTSSTGSAQGRRRRNVRAVTIDLEATEVGESGEDETVKEPEPSAEAKSENDNSAPPDAADPGSTDVDDGDQPTDPAKDTNIPVLAYLKYGAAGLAGGMLALLIYSGLARIGFAPIPTDNGSVELAGSLAELRHDIAGQDSDRASRLGDIETRLSALSAGEPDTDIAGRLDDFDSRIAVLGKEIAAVDAAGIQRLGEAREAASAEITDLSERLAATSDADETAPRLAGLEARLGVLETNTESLLADLQAAAGSGDGAGVVGADVLVLRQALTNLQASANDLKASLTARMDGLDEIIDAAGSVSSALSVRIDETKSALDQRVGDLEEMISALPDQPFSAGEPGAESRAAASLAFAALERMIREGLPYRTELELLASVTGAIPDDIVTTLAAGADNGVATIANLTEQFDVLANRIIEADSGQTDGGFLDQTLTRIRSVVRIRPTGFVEGDSVGAIVARAEAHLGAGQLKAAIDELVQLEGPAGEAAAEWFGAANARLDIGAALVALNRQLLGAAGRADAGESQ